MKVNRIIFEDRKLDINFIVHTVLEQLQLHPVSPQLKLKRRFIGSASVYYFTIGFFDGVSTNLMGGIGVHILISQDHYFCLKMGVGQSTNTRSKLLALWTLLISAKLFGMPYLHIHGDSTVMINWFNMRLK